MYLFKLIKEYIRRILRNYKIYSITILGMSIAIIASFHIYFFVQKEYSVDAFHTNKKEVYRVIHDVSYSNLSWVSTVLPLGEKIQSKYPEVTNYARYVENFPFLNLIQNGKTTKAIFQLADPSFFKMFSFPLIKGSLENFKNNPASVLITEEKAAALFPNQNPIGKILQISEGNINSKDVIKYNLEVVGVLKNISKRSTIQGSVFINMDFFKSLKLSASITNSSSWSFPIAELYLQIPTLNNKADLEENISNLFFENYNLNNPVQYHIKEKNKDNYKLQSLEDVYFTSESVSDQKIKGSKQFVNVLWLIGFLTLLLATTNYIIMNLGLNLNRAKEFKARRYLGATKTNIFLQLSTESLINVSLCYTIALLTYPLFNNSIAGLLEFEYQLSYQSDMGIVLSFYAILVGIGILTGLLQYVILYKSVFVENKSTKKVSISISTIIKGLVGFQLFLFIGIISSAVLVQKQNSFLKNKDLGFDLKHVMSVSSSQSTKNAFEDLLISKSYVKATSNGVFLFNKKSDLKKYKIDNTAKEIKASYVLGDENYIKVHQIKIIQGQNFNWSSGSRMTKDERRKGRGEKKKGVIVNEEFVRAAALINPIGTLLNDGEYQIVGVFKNIYNMPLHNPVVPTLISYSYYIGISTFQVLYKPGYRKNLLKDTYAFLENNGINKGDIKSRIQEFDYKEVYKKEVQLKNLLQLFTGIVLIIAVLGLIAISLFITQNRTKEIGIRKINGATIIEVLKMLNKSFVIWVAIAFVFAVPISYIIMQKWLQNFAFKTVLSWWVFALAGLIVLVIALLAVSWQTYKAATQNPVNSLRDD